MYSYTSFAFVRVCLSICVCVCQSLQEAADKVRGANFEENDPKKNPRPALRMAGEQPEQVIDFGKVGFAEADNQVCTLPALSSGHTSAKAHCPLPVGESQFSFVGSFQSSEPP